VPIAKKRKVPSPVLEKVKRWRRRMKTGTEGQGDAGGRDGSGRRREKERSKKIRGVQKKKGKLNKWSKTLIQQSKHPGG